NRKMAKKKAKTRLPRWLPGRIRLSVVAAAVLVFGGLFAVIHASRVPEPRPSDHLRVALPPPSRPAPARLREPAKPPSASTVPAPIPAPAPAPAPPAAPAQAVPPSSSALPAWRRFAAVTPQGIEDRKLIAIVIDDMGVDRK